MLVMVPGWKTSVPWVLRFKAAFGWGLIVPICELGRSMCKENKNNQEQVAHTCNPSYSGGRDRRIAV
jgi:hypothetical protein